MSIPHNPTLLAAIEKRKVKESQLKELLATGQYAALDTRLNAYQTVWAAGDVHAPDGYLALASSGALFDHATHPKLTDKIAIVNQWIAAAPQSYHAHVLLGDLWCSVAAAIRGSGWASSVSPAMWMGARFARDKCCAILLHAITLDNKPSTAYQTIMQVTAYLQEPEWLVDLFRGEMPMPYGAPDDPEERQVWADGFDLYQKYGGDLIAFPRELPKHLPPRQPHEFEEGRLYWLQRALETNPKDMWARRSAVYYLYPRWGGSHEEMAAFINGPLCAALTEAERGELWRVKEDDELNNWPDTDDKENITAYKKRWQKLLARPAIPKERTLALLEYGKFLSYCDDLPASYAAYSEAATVHAENAVPIGFSDDELKYLLIDTFGKVAGKVADKVADKAASTAGDAEGDAEGVLKHFTTHTVALNENAWCALVCAAGHHSGISQFERDEVKAQQYLAIGVKSMQSADQHDWDINELCRNIWKNNQFETAYWLASQFEIQARQINKPNATALLFLKDLLRNALTPDTPESMRNEAQGLAFLEQAAQTGHARSQSSYVTSALLKGEYANVKEPLYSQAKEMLYKAMEGSDDNHARLALMRLMVDSGPISDQRWAHDNLIPVLLEEGDDNNIEWRTAQYLADIYNNGKGGFKSYDLLAQAWAKVALEYESTDTFCADILKQGKKGGILTLLNKTFSKGDLRKALDEGQVFAPDDFEL